MIIEEKVTIDGNVVTLLGSGGNNLQYYIKDHINEDDTGVVLIYIVQNGVVMNTIEVSTEASQNRAYIEDVVVTKVK